MKDINKSYIVVFDPAEEGGYNVSFPQFPGCVTFGKDIKEAKKMAQEALELWLEETNKPSNVIVKELPMQAV